MIPQGSYIEVENDFKFHYYDEGDGDVVVLLHGSGTGASGHTNFKNNFKALKEAGYRVILPDLPGYGFSSRRDSKGIAKRSGSWAHAMAWIACDDTRKRHNELLFLVQNSWGKWNSGPRVHDQPEGSFWIREKDARGMLAGNWGSWVFSNVDGFPARKLPNYNFTKFL